MPRSSGTWPRSHIGAAELQLRSRQPVLHPTLLSVIPLTCDFSLNNSLVKGEHRLSLILNCDITILIEMDREMVG